MTRRVAEGAAELFSVMQRFSALSECALRACESGDEAALAGALDARDLVTRRLAPLLRELTAARRSAQDDHTRGEIDRLLAPVQFAAREAGQLNTVLEARAREARGEIGAQLARLSHDDSARSAYAAVGARPDGGRLDTRR